MQFLFQTTDLKINAANGKYKEKIVRENKEFSFWNLSFFLKVTSKNDIILAFCG